MDNDKVICEIVETGSDITGAVGGALIGTIIAGPLGGIIGGASGPLITKAFKAVGSTVKNKLLADREETRIGAAYYFAMEQFQYRINAGHKIVSNISSEELYGRNASEEVLEGIIISAQQSYEEKKIKFIGKLFANIFFNSQSDLALSNFMIKLADELSYRQFCIINILRNKDELNLQGWLDKNKDGNPIITRYDLCCETRYLKDKGIVTLPFYLSNMEDNSDSIQIKDLSITNIGNQFYDLLSLSEIEILDINELLQNMKRNNSH